VRVVHVWDVGRRLRVCAERRLLEEVAQKDKTIYGSQQGVLGKSEENEATDN
jgi:hypothetical protein